MDEHDMMQESILWPWIDDESFDSDAAEDECNYDPCDDECDESMDGDFDSGMRDAGFGTEDYGFYGDE
jgi:hypothetical protein